MTQKEMFERDLKRGDINYEEHFKAYLYEYHGSGWTDEIVLGHTLEDAFTTYCDINK